MFNIKKGFTLIEIMIVVAIFALVGIVLMNIFQQTNRTFYQGQLKNIVDSEAQLLIENLKRDLSMSCKIETSANYRTESILNVRDISGGKEVIFGKFHSYEKGKPIAKKVKYTYDSNTKTVTREYDNERPRIWEGIESFTLHYYELLPHHRKFYNIQVLFEIGHEVGKLKKEKIMFATSVESRYENHLVNFPGWIKNPDSVIQ
ncbi:MAG: type II secretion system protein [Candidatus Muiribacteriota bacterium]